MALLHIQEASANPDFTHKGPCSHNAHARETRTSMDNAAGCSNTCHAKLNECLPTSAGKVQVLMTFLTLEESTQVEGERVEWKGSSSRHECHRFPVLLLKVDQLLTHKYFSDCWKPLVEFQGTEMVVFACFADDLSSKLQTSIILSICIPDCVALL